MSKFCTRKPSLIPLLIVCCFHLSNVLASSTGPPPPPPPPPRNDSGNSYDRDRYNNDNGRRRNDYDQRSEYSRGRGGRDNEINNPRNDRDRDRDRHRDDSYRRNDPIPPPASTGRRREERSNSSNANAIPMDPSRRQKPKSSYSMFSRKQEPDRFDVDVDDAEKFNHRERKDTPTDNSSDGNNNNTGIGTKPESSEEKSYNPIDYQFPSRKIPSMNDGPKDEQGELPQTSSGEEEQNNIETNSNGRHPMPQYASARQDAIARYSSTPLGKLKLATSTYFVGGAIGGFLGQSMLNQGKLFVILSGFLFLIMSWLRNDYGEMSRSLGLGFIYLARRTKSVRRRYKTGPHLRGMCRLGPRKPFPPVFEDEEENPWRYAPQSRDDPDFEMAKALLCMVVIGSFCGGNVPLIPTWMGSAAGAAAFGIFGIAKNPRGDLIRAMGMKVVALIGEAIVINSELRVARKVARVGGKIFDKMMILDSKHRIKDRIVKGASWAYERASNTAARVQEDVKEGKESRDTRGDTRDTSNRDANRPRQQGRD
jgi:hypothetical protein